MIFTEAEHIDRIRKIREVECIGLQQAKQIVVGEVMREKLDALVDITELRPFLHELLNEIYPPSRKGII